jgi:hypothetical protein
MSPVFSLLSLASLLGPRMPGAWRLLLLDEEFCKVSNVSGRIDVVAECDQEAATYARGGACIYSGAAARVKSSRPQPGTGCLSSQADTRN